MSTLSNLVNRNPAEDKPNGRARNTKYLSLPEMQNLRVASDQAGFPLNQIRTDTGHWGETYVKFLLPQVSPGRGRASHSCLTLLRD